MVNQLENRENELAMEEEHAVKEFKGSSSASSSKARPAPRRAKMKNINNMKT